MLQVPIGQLISRYRIVRELGAGGMGRVYLAEDPSLGRKVAVKLLPPELGRDPERLRRFEQEARAASALNHPNILTVHETGEWEGSRYLVTELVEGETLRQRMARGGLALPEALAIAIQVADALAAAHAAGIVHRDVKPENLMVRRDGWVKVVDFGLAKPAELQDAVTAVARTATGVVMGTLHYMAPEQARGVGVDARTDLFSLGVVLYEMVSGRLPFPGRTATDVLVAILQAEPAPLGGRERAVPGELERIVARALAKAPEDRYQTARDLGADLRHLEQRLVSRPAAGDRAAALAVPPTSATTTGWGDTERVAAATLRRRGTVRRAAALAAATALVALAAAGLWLARQDGADAIETLAVIPFAVASGDEDAAYVAEGIGDGLINSLSQLPRLKVMSRSAVRRYDTAPGAPPADPARVAAELGVRGVVTGRVSRRGDDLLVAVELVDARDGWLARARAEDPADMLAVATAEDYTFLRSDPRFAALVAGR